MGIRLPAHQGGDPGVITVLLLVTPAVEVEVHQREIPLLVLHEDAAGIPQPDVVQLGVDEAGVVLATQLARQIFFLLVAEHAHLGVGGHGLDQPAYGGLHLPVISPPDIGARAKGNPDPSLRGGLVRHLVTANGSGQRASRGSHIGSLCPWQAAQPGQGADGGQLFQYIASGWHGTTPD
ncbi:hypothetical protein D3C85_1198020 [compost metagenome]